MSLHRDWLAPALLGAVLLSTSGCRNRERAVEPVGTESSPEARAHALLNERFPADSPGAAVLVARRGKILLLRGYGLADIARRIPVTPATKFRIGSMTKEFTSAGILRLQEAGKLSVKDPLSRYYPDFPRADEITLHHLLSHTSGIHNYIATPFFDQYGGVPVTPDTVIGTFRSHPFTFDPGKPGRIWGYTNSGYFLLGEIIARVSGQTYGEHMKKEFFVPLGMTNTGAYSSERPPQGIATGYVYENGRFGPSGEWHASWLGGAGVLYSDVRDVYRWYEAVFGGKVLSPASRKAAWSVYSTARNAPGFSDFDYGYGWVIARVRGARELSHAGAVPGFIGNAIRLPDYELTVAVLENEFPPAPGRDPIALSREIAGIFLDDELPPVSPSNPAVAGDGPILEITPPPLD